MPENDSTNYGRKNYYSHPSFDADQALQEAEEKYALDTYGVEGDAADNGEGHITIQYLNTGDSYETTLIYYRDQFLIGTVGDIIEKAHS